MQMRAVVVVVALMPCLLVGRAGGSSTSGEQSEAMASAFKVYEDRLAEIESYFANLARQVMLQQFNSEQRTRTDGYSGVKSVRGSTFGERNYYSESYLGNRFMSIHDHADFIRTVGMGEINAVINGVEFTTRHNDYSLVMPSTTSTDYHATEPLPFPEVPRSVSELDDVGDQIKEMRAYFQAFTTQNSSLRDYRPYFKPTLCYMEGAWTLDKSIDEPFQSDRHQLDAASWLHLQSLIRYGAYTGTKSPEENFAHLPTAIMHVNKTTGEPAFAQWNYRILCHPIEEDIPLSYLKLIEDLHYTVPHGRVADDNRNLRIARFTLSELEEPRYETYGMLDRIFYTVPGKDNTPTGLRQETYGHPLYVPGSEKELLDTSRYTRSAQLGGSDAMGNKFMARGFNDPNMFCAETTQSRIAPITLERCKTRKRKGKKVEKCKTVQTRFSWAIPLEIIYLTPLSTWNPYHLAYSDNKGDATGGREFNGNTKDTAYNGTDRSHYYITPVEFYKNLVNSEDSADTAKSGVWVKDRSNTPRRCSAAGPRILTQKIEGVGRVRLRYPIAPVHGEGSAVWKELNALADWVKSRSDAEKDKSAMVNFEMSETSKDPLAGTPIPSPCLCLTSRRFETMVRPGL